VCQWASGTVARLTQLSGRSWSAKDLQLSFPYQFIAALLKCKANCSEKLTPNSNSLEMRTTLRYKKIFLEPLYYKITYERFFEEI
jgi:hypothetical protein